MGEREKSFTIGWGIAAVDEMNREESDIVRELKEKKEDVQRQEDDRRIREAKFNREYKKEIEEQIYGIIYMG